MPANRPQRVRSTPQISVNQLAAYLGAGAVRRNSILKQQKFPSDFMVTYYKDSCDAIIEFLCGGSDAIDRALDTMYNRTPTDTRTYRSDGDCIQALQAFLEVYDGLGIDALSFQRAPMDNTKLTLKGVDISVRPELFLEAPGARGRRQFGLLKLYLSRNVPLSDESGQYIATTMKMWAQQTQSDREYRDNLIMVLDIFTGKVYTAPRAFTRRARDIEQACSEIATMWPTISKV